MKKFLKILGIGLGIFLLAVITIFAYAGFTPMKTFEVHAPEVNIPTDSAGLAFGKRIVETKCVHCHLGEDGKLSGRLFNRKEDPFGEMWTANITQHPTSGIGRYTDGELAYLLRTGINRDGRFVGYMMAHPKLSDEHLASLIGFLRSDADIMQAVDVQRPLPEYLTSTMLKTFILLGMYAPLPYDGKPINAPSVTDQTAYGKYLATEVFECYGCHSASFETLNPFEPEKSAGYFGGGNLVADEDFVKVVSPNITPSKEFGIGNWTEEEFINVVKTGSKKDGTILKSQMPRFAQLSDEEVHMIWAYLQTIPALENNPKASAK